MELKTTRFGPIPVDPADVIHFPAGLLGLADHHDWVLLAADETLPLAWLQSVDRPDLALPVVSPQRFLPGYQLRVARQELAPLQLPTIRAAELLVIVGRCGPSLTLNLKGPLVINVARRIGRQVVANGLPSVRYQLAPAFSRMKKIA